MEYYNPRTGEVVPEDCMKAYVENVIGFPLPKGENGEYTEEQKEAIKMLIEWYFSGEWIEQEIDEDIPNLERDFDIADRKYQDSLDEKWGI